MPGEPAVGLGRRLDAQRLLDQVGNALRVLAQLVLQRLVLGEVADRLGEHARRGLLAGGEEEGGRADHGRHVGCRAVRVPGQRESGHDVVTRLAPAVLDVSGERARQPAERVALAGPVWLAQFTGSPAKTEAGSYLVEVLVRPAQHPG